MLQKQQNEKVVHHPWETSLTELKWASVHRFTKTTDQKTWCFDPLFGL